MAREKIMRYRPKVYVASKIWHAPMWRERRDYPTANRLGWDHVEITSRWIDMEHLESGPVPTPADFGHFWTIDICDVRRSDFVLLYAGEVDDDRRASGWNFGQDSDSLRGGLVEAGAALALGKTVVSVGLSGNHSWSYHPLSVRLSSLEEARKFFFRYHI